MIGEAYQVLSDCQFCLVEAAVVELMDPLHPACHLGIPVDVRCRLCGWRVQASEEPFAPRMPLSAGRCPACQKHLDEAARTGEGPCPHCSYTPTVAETARPVKIATSSVAEARLRAWADDEGEPDLERFCEANMGLSAKAVVARLVEGEAVSTTFDVIAFLFPGSMGGGSSPDAEIVPKKPTEVVDRSPQEAPREARAPSPTGPDDEDPMIAARALVSVMVADGELRAGERTFIDAYLRNEQLPPVQQADLRIWRPHELGVPREAAHRMAIIEAMIHLMHLDRERDGSEWKVIHAFARYWGLSESELETLDKRYDRRYRTIMTALWRTLSSFVRIR